MIELDQRLFDRLNQILTRDSEAVRFIVAFNEYCHAVDDIIDGDAKVDKEFIIKTFIQATALYSSNFYHKYAVQLYPIVLNLTNSYADSVKWEGAEEKWKRDISDVLRMSANDMITIVVGLVGGYDAMREVSCLMREVGYNRNHDTQGLPV